LKKIIILAFTAAALAACNKASAPDQATQSAAASTPSVAIPASAVVVTPTPPPAPPQPATSWRYSSAKDEMRGTEKFYAMLTSDNQVQLDFPYQGGSSLTLAVRKYGKEATDVLLFIDKGQVTCHMSGCELAVKFDDEPVSSVHAHEAAGGSTNAVFIDYPTTFIKKMKASKHLMLELPLYQAGDKQFKFETAAFEWSH
jgi:hypothetical protein